MTAPRSGRKLIRDLVPVNDGGREGPRATGDEYRRLLFAKLIEEAREAADALQAAPELAVEELAVEELADVLEVLQAAAGALPGGWGRVLHAQALKLARRGGFMLGRTYCYPESRGLS